MADQPFHVGEIVRETGSPSQVRSVIGSSLLLGGLSSEHLSAVLACGSVQRRQRGRAVLNPGEDATVVLLDGVVASHAVSSSGTEFIRRLHGAGETIGLLGVLGYPSANDELTAQATVQMLRVPGADLRGLIGQHSEVARACLRTVTAQLARSEHEDDLLVGTTTWQRVSLRLLELAERFGQAGPSGIHVIGDLTQQELAAWARVSLESASRALHGLREAQVIYTGRRELIVRDIEALRHRASHRPDDPTWGRLLASIG